MQVSCPCHIGRQAAGAPNLIPAAVLLFKHQLRGRLLLPNCHIGAVQAVETGLAWCQRITGSTELPALLRVADSALVQYMAQLQVWLLAEVKHSSVNVKGSFMHEAVIAAD